MNFTSKFKGTTILVVEDNPTVRNEIAHQLRSRGYSTFIAKNGDDALNKMRTFGKIIDAIVTDYNMGSNGAYNADYLLRNMAEEKIPMKPTVLFTAEPGNALNSMYDVLGIKSRSEYTDTPLPTHAELEVVEGDIIQLTKQYFANPENGLTLFVVPKTIGSDISITGYEEVIARLVEMGITAPDTAQDISLG